MDSGTAIVGIICLLVCTLPFVYGSMNRKKKDRKVLEALNSIATIQKCKITQHDICHNYGIGIDENENFAFFQLKNGKEFEPTYVDLATVNNCSINKITRTAVNNEKLIEQLHLEFSSKQKNGKPMRFEFFNADKYFQLSDEIKMINKWNEIINNQLK